MSRVCLIELLQRSVECVRFCNRIRQFYRYHLHRSQCTYHHACISPSSFRHISITHLLQICQNMLMCSTKQYKIIVTFVLLVSSFFLLVKDLHYVSATTRRRGGGICLLHV